MTTDEQAAKNKMVLLRNTIGESRFMQAMGWQAKGYRFWDKYRGTLSIPDVVGIDVTYQNHFEKVDASRGRG